MSDVRRDTFHRYFGHSATVFAEAPGRVNLIGEHTDYNGGFVLPTAIPQRTHAELALRSDSKVRILSHDIGPNGEEHDYMLGDERPLHRWFDYVAGITWLLRERGYAIRGFDLRVSTDIPMGAGLSSSASLLVTVLRALRQAFDLPLNDVDLALMSQSVENGFVGAHVGIMDQMAASLADSGTALFLDTRSLEYRKIMIPDDIDMFIINSGVRHSHADGGYNTRRMECEEACSHLGVKELRDVQDINLTYAIGEPFGSRARHVISENARVLKAVDAISRGSMEELGRLMIESHASMRDNFKVSVPEIDFLVEASLAHPEVYGARLTGGGFGGSIVGICRKGHGKRLANLIADRYQSQTSHHASILVP
ncbi:MAG: galactokinase [Chitinophagaceae bacterium]|nr:galactokinase [Oligoflexus sp.]